jgi:hypothetical protein
MQHELPILRAELGVVSGNRRLADEDVAGSVSTDREERIPHRISAPLELVYEVGAIVARSL